MENVVYRTLEPGFIETVYQEALAIGLAEKGRPFQKEVLIEINYKGKELNCTYRAFVNFGDHQLRYKRFVV